ncbi:alpha-amylase family protein [Salinigranum marinum]|uniref:alpha-amylase family protein n=1 Tax=Salinigranum marinum TaxID=1515595 RepID=UPI002989F760|nr:alpha-amylase family protein [Salinigranum marinum]
MARARHGDLGWYRNAVIYSLDVKTFNDADGDGWGDFQGLTERLGYLETLGVDCLWLRPFFPSPLADNGYDVADYYGVDSRVGTLGDFADFVEAADDRGIRVLCDMVFNHTSDQHRWFQRARDDPGSKYHDYYLWTSHLESAHKRGNIFPEYEDGVWSYDEAAGKHYFHQFYGFQPDLNVANPQVQAEIRRVLEFWLDRGVDGFRIDAAHPMTMPKGHNATTLEEGTDFFRRMRSWVEEAKSDAILIAEADEEPEHLDQYFGDGDGFDLMFNFVLNAHLTYAVGVKDTWPLYRTFEVLPDVSDVGQWANFLRNHDEWNLLKLPWDAFEHARDFFGDDEGDSWIFGRGHRLRLADLYVGDHDRIACAHSLMFSLPGTPVVLSGDEIGMGADLDLPERESVRTPMQWSDNRNGGFSTADADELYHPVIDEGRYGYQSINVADQLRDQDSLLNRIRRLVDARTLCTELSNGDFSIADVEPKEVWVHRVDHGRTTLLTAHNLAAEPRTVTVDFDAPADATTRVVGPGDYEVDGGRATFDLDATEYAWLRGDRRGERVPLGSP